MRTDTHKCDSGHCNGLCEFDRQCGAYVCINCGKHVGLVRCFCGWALNGGDGRKQLEDMGETIDPEPCGSYDEGMGQGGDAYNDVMFGESPDY